MSEASRIIINGFSFADEAEGRQAAKEAEGVRYIREKVDMDRPEHVLHIYNKVVREELFETVIGFSYLKELQEYLRSIPFIEEDAILDIPVRHTAFERSIRRQEEQAGHRSREGAQKTEVRHADYRVRYRVMRMLCIVLAVCVAGMFVITATSNSPNILNYEQRLIDRYETWENELTERERALSDREAALWEVEQGGTD